MNLTIERGESRDYYLTDERLNRKSKELLTIMLSYDDDAEFMLKNVRLSGAASGIYAKRSAFRKLCELGYADKRKLVSANGFISYLYAARDFPKPRLDEGGKTAEKTTVENQKSTTEESENPNMEKSKNHGGKRDTETVENPHNLENQALRWRKTFEKLTRKYRNGENQSGKNENHTLNPGEEDGNTTVENEKTTVEKIENHALRARDHKVFINYNNTPQYTNVYCPPYAQSAQGGETHCESVKFEKRERTSRAKRFKAPTEAEVRAYCMENGYATDARKFILYYAARGWKIGKTLMRDWKSAVQFWAHEDEARRAEREKSAPKPEKKTSGWQLEQSSFDGEDFWEAAVAASYGNLSTACALGC